ncbi:MAG: hypothetical protein KF760_10290 [Candidatus Eremiobacteraeota bacterium]|nr:hypothetical protein [Candidatus Eremiobacteraeota bacterium]MCW5867679.1 hypothetical protein [Candidatus Eremiobacteraeota bacterium]
MDVALEYHPAYRVITVAPLPAWAGLKVPLSLLRQLPEEYLGPLRCDSPQAAYRQVLELAETMPGVPLGLTFDGGIAITHTDYRLAEQRWREANP